jgi:hypothetical protein
MSDMRTAILNGAYAAGRVHQELNLRDAWEHSGGRIDVFGAIDKSTFH